MTQIQWYPGHMAKAKRLMQDALKSVDMVIEIRDSRVVNASKNPMIESLIGQKPRLIILSKKDKADKDITDKWVKKLENENTKVIAIDLLKDNVTKICVDACKDVMKEKIAKMISKGINPRAIRAMVVGIPNVGKSTMINSLTKRKIAQTANKPGVTRSLQWIKINKEVELLDTPGVLWPKFDDVKVGYFLALTGAINDNILNLEDVAVFGMTTLMHNYPDLLTNYYGITLSENPYDNILSIGKAKNLIKKNNEVDYERSIKLFISDLRQDKLGKISWESPDEDK